MNAALARTRLGLVLALLGASACRGGPSSTSSATIVVRATEGPSPAANGALRCDRDGKACSPLVAGERLAYGGLVKTTRSGHATLELDDGALVELGDDASIALEQGDRRSIQIDRGSVSIDVAATHADKGKLVVRVLDRTAALAEDTPASVTARVTAADHALVSVRRGALALERDEQDRPTLVAGETADVVLGARIDERAAWSGPDLSDAIAATRALTPKETPVTSEAPKEPAQDEATSAPPARGLGSMTARVPGTRDVVSGVRLVLHHVDVVVHDGFARTQVEEEFRNDTARVLEGRYAFPVPPDATVSRLALWVGKDLVEGEIVEKDRAARIFQGIVDDTVRPRDPALLEWVAGSELALRVFPIPAGGSRKIVLAYDQALPSAGGRTRYVYPLSLGADRAVTIGDFAVHVGVTDALGRIGDVDTPRYAPAIDATDRACDVSLARRDFTPDGDFVVTWERRTEDVGGARVATVSASSAPAAEREAAAKGEGHASPDAFAAVRTTIDLPADFPLPEATKRDRVIVVDQSFSQSKETLAGAIEIALGLVRDLDPSERFALLACDSACASYPEDGLVAASDVTIEAAARWLTQTSSGDPSKPIARAPGGSSNVAGAIVDGARRLDPTGAGQLVVLGDGSPTSGELTLPTIVDRVRPVLDAHKVDLRLLGAGRGVDEIVLAGLARELGGAYTRVATGERLTSRVASLATDLRRPVLKNVRVELPASMRDVYPKALPNLHVGEEIVLAARLSRADAGSLVITGELDGKPVRLERPLAYRGDLVAQNPVVPRLWAEARIAELAASDDKTARDETIELSKRYRVMTHATSLLVLENDRMFAEFGVTRTKSDATENDPFASAVPVTPPRSEPALALPSPAAAPRNAWGDDEARKDPMSARGNMWGDSIGDSFGAGGLGLSGIGEGGAGKGAGIGLGSVGTLGHGSGFGNGSGRLSGTHKTASPRVRMGATTVSGRLPPEVIQRIVRQNFGRFRLCYEKGLVSNPNLQGRVSVRFVIGTSGEVKNVANGGSDLANDTVVACVVNAFKGLAFPEPEGGVVTVTYPILFSPPDDSTPRSMASTTFGPPPWSGAPPDWFAPVPVATHAAGDGKWMFEGEEAITKARQALASTPDSRQKHEALVRTLLARGRFAEARDRARAFAALDPDLPVARELVAWAEAANGDGAAAVRAIDALVETAPRTAAAHLRAARAFEAAGDEKRACAHWRSTAELTKSDDALAEALRCRARAESDRAGALAEAHKLDKPGKLVGKIIETLAAGSVPAHAAEDAAVGSFEAKVACGAEKASCPTVAIVLPTGAVVSPWTPATTRASARAVSFANVPLGTYRTIVVGDASAEAEVEVRALGAARKFKILPGAKTIAATTVASALGPTFRAID